MGKKYAHYHVGEEDCGSYAVLPLALIREKEFRSLSMDAKVLYCLFCDRTRLSVRNDWRDENGDIYIIYPIDEVAEDFGCGKNKAINLVSELEDFGLIEKKRRGMGKPNLIYVNNYQNPLSDDPDSEDLAEKNDEDVEKFKNQTSRSLPDEKFKNQTSRSLENKLLEVEKTNRNQLNINQPYMSNAYHPSIYRNADTSANVSDGWIDGLRKTIKRNISYGDFESAPKPTRARVDELLELIVDVVSSPPDATFLINKQEKTASVVKNIFMKLTREHIEYVLESMDQKKSIVANPRNYMITALYNSVLTLDMHYRNEAATDMAAGEYESVPVTDEA